jgi:hypothetical protein
MKSFKTIPVDKHVENQLRNNLWKSETW